MQHNIRLQSLYSSAVKLISNWPTNLPMKFDKTVICSSARQKYVINDIAIQSKYNAASKVRRYYLPESSPPERERGCAHVGVSRGRYFAGRRRSSRYTSWQWRHAGVTWAGELSGGVAGKTSLCMRRTEVMTSSMTSHILRIETAVCLCARASTKAHTAGRTATPHTPTRSLAVTERPRDCICRWTLKRSSGVTQRH